MKWLALLITLLGSVVSFLKWRSIYDPEKIHKQINQKRSEIEGLEEAMDKWFANRGGPDEFLVLHRRYTKACTELHRLRTRLPEGDPARSE